METVVHMPLCFTARVYVTMDFANDRGEEKRNFKRETCTSLSTVRDLQALLVGGFPLETHRRCDLLLL